MLEIVTCPFSTSVIGGRIPGKTHPSQRRLAAPLQVLLGAFQTTACAMQYFVYVAFLAAAPWSIYVE